MTPYVADPDFTLYLGDVREVLAELPDESVHCVVTSPPYWSLRDYGVEGQLGLEPTPDEYVQNMVAVFREVRRVLRRDGTCWLNLGSSYASGMGGGLQGKDGQRADRTFTAEGMGKPVPPGYKPKDMVPIPWMVAMALQADGWYLRADIIWAKPNPMPESVTDRPTKAHEYLFLLTRSPRYFYDADAIRESATWERWGGQTTVKYDGQGTSKAEMVQRRSKGEIADRFDTSQRNARSVWEIATQPYPEAHFATFPEELARRCILAGTSERGCCPECGAPWVREVERQKLVLKEPAVPIRERRGDDVNDKRTALSGTQVIPASSTTIGWKPSCAHGHEPAPCVVLDPFLGSGTTALVARRHGRKTIGIELNPEYADLAAKRLQQLSLLAEETA